MALDSDSKGNEKQKRKGWPGVPNEGISSLAGVPLPGVEYREPSGFLEEAANGLNQPTALSAKESGQLPARSTEADRRIQELAAKAISDRFLLFSTFKDGLTDPDYFDVLGYVWVHSERPFIEHVEIRSLFAPPGRSLAQQRRMMTPNEAAVLDGLPNKINVFRGKDTEEALQWLELDP